MRPHLGKGSSLTLDSLGPFLLELIPGGQGEPSLERPLPSRGDCVLRDSTPSFPAPAGQQPTPGLGGISTLRLKAILRASHQLEGPKIS